MFRKHATPFMGDTLAALERRQAEPLVTILKTAAVGKTELLPVVFLPRTLPPMAHQRPRDVPQPMG